MSVEAHSSDASKLRQVHEVKAELDEFLAESPSPAPQANLQSSIGPANEERDGCLCRACYSIFNCVWTSLENLWDLVVSLLYQGTRPESPEAAALRERGRKLDAMHAEHQRNMATRDAQSAEWKKVADDVASFEASLSQIENQLDRWKNACDILSFPSAVVCALSIQPSPKYELKAHYNPSSIECVRDKAAVKEMLHRFTENVRAFLERNRKDHARSLRNFGSRSWGYQLPECRIEMSFVHIKANQEKKFDGTWSRVTLQPQGTEPDIVIGEIAEKTFDGKTLEEVQAVFNAKGMSHADPTLALLELSGEL